MLALRDDELEGPVGLEPHLLLVHRVAGARPPATETAAREQVEAEPPGIAARAPDAVVVPAVERSPEVVVVGVLADDLDGLVACPHEHGFGGATVLELRFEGAAEQAGEHPEPLGSLERIR